MGTVILYPVSIASGVVNFNAIRPKQKTVEPLKCVKLMDYVLSLMVNVVLSVMIARRPNPANVLVVNIVFQLMDAAFKLVKQSLYSISNLELII